MPAKTRAQDGISQIEIPDDSLKDLQDFPEGGIYGTDKENFSEDGEGETVILTRCRYRRAKTGNAGKIAKSPIAYRHLSRENSQIKKLADDPASSNRWCLIRDGQPYQPRAVNRPVNRGWLEELGSLGDCRRALLLLALDPPITDFVCLPEDGERVLFPVIEERAPEEPTRAPEEIPQRKLEIPEDGKSPDRAPEPEAPEEIPAGGKSEPSEPAPAPESPAPAPKKTSTKRKTGMRKNCLFDSVLSVFGKSNTNPAGGTHD